YRYLPPFPTRRSSDLDCLRYRRHPRLRTHPQGQSRGPDPAADLLRVQPAGIRTGRPGQRPAGTFPAADRCRHAAVQRDAAAAAGADICLQQGRKLSSCHHGRPVRSGPGSPESRRSSSVCRESAMPRLYHTLSAASISLLSGLLHAAEPLSLPAQTILGGGNDDRDLRLPLARHTLDSERIHAANAGANLSEPLQRVPGLVALNRQNYAQDLQISSRGFGARSQFGVRGVRLVQDGIPLTMPDGQGQPALFDLDGLQRIEVLRGPLTTLYGNASGGIIQGYTGEAPFHPTLDTRTLIGSDGLWRSRLRYGGQHGDLNISANVSRLETDGY